jgi:hypothetical protein
MLFCSHNEVDVEPIIINKRDRAGHDVDWVVVRCASCERIIGKKRRLVDLVDRAIKERQERLGG